MSSVQTRALFATTSARLRALYALLLTSSFVLTGILTWWVSLSAAEHELRDRLELEMYALRAEVSREEVGPIAKAIAARAERPGSMKYWFVDHTGRVLAGDLPAMNVRDGWSNIDISNSTQGAEGRYHLLILAQTLPDGARLAIGDDLNQGDRVRDTILSALLWIGAVTLGVGLLAGIIATRGLLARMAHLNQTVGRVAEGDLAARVPLNADGPLRPCCIIAAWSTALARRATGMLATTTKVFATTITSGAFTGDIAT